MKILVSACLLGENCKYSGGNNYNQQSATGAKSLRRLVYCRPDAGQNKIPRRCSSRIYSKISPSSSFLPYCSSVPSISLQISLIDIFRPHFSR